ncbi:MAG: ATP-binding protein, partial [Pseudomonadota bacterium]
PEVFEVIGRYVDEINTAGNRGKELVSKLLTYSRGGRAEKIEVDVAEVIDETTRLIRPTFPASIGLELSLAPGIIALASPIELQQVIMNLCLNARDALDGHGHIRITLVGRSRVKDVCSACFSPIDGEFIAITISDNGPGIPPSQHPHIFEPFFSTKGVGGTGLGLSMVHGILHEHQGHILLRSDEAKGTAFDILLPPNGPIATAPPAPTPAQSGRF